MLQPLNRNYYGKRNILTMRLLLALILSLPVVAQTTRTTISGVVVTDPNHNPVDGRLSITASKQFLATGGELVSTKTFGVSIVAGQFTVALIPNDTGSPMDSYYIIEYNIVGGGRYREFWRVPTTGVTIPPPIIFVPLVPVPSIGLSQIMPSGALVGQVLTFNGTSWVPGTGGRCFTITASTGSTITHNLGTTTVDAVFLDGSNNEFRPARWTITGSNTISWSADSAKTGQVCIK